MTDSLLPALMYVFENFIQGEIKFEKPKEILDEMIKHGFERDCALQAIDWFVNLAELQPAKKTFYTAASPNSFRIYLDYERHKITDDARLFLQQLEMNGIIDAYLREVIIHLSMALNEPVVDEAEMTWVSLMTLYGLDDKKDELALLQDMVMYGQEDRAH